MANKKSKKTVHLRVNGGSTQTTRTGISALWGPKSLDTLIDLELKFSVAPDAAALKRLKAAQAYDGWAEHCFAPFYASLTSE
jgi:hypothetical protein